LSQITVHKPILHAALSSNVLVHITLCILIFSSITQAQVTDSSTIVLDTTAILTDTTNLATDSLAVATDSLQQQGDIETTIEYTAKDSINYDMLTGKVFLYGDAKVTYGNMVIEAAEIQFDMKQSTVYANGVPDSTGTLTGIPVFTQAGQTYNAEKMTYNMKTEKGIISGIVTQQGDGYIKSGVVKRTPENAMYAAGNIYTTCNLEQPHFGIRAQQLKIVPNKYVIAGPFNFELNGVPTPLGFAFGLFPFSDKRSAGLIVPTYGETRERGFYLRDGGFYLPVGEYAGVKLLGQIYSLGGWGASLESNYKVRYKFGGGFSVSYNNVKRQLDNLETSETIDYWIRWRHSPVSRGTGRFSANVNVGSSSFNRNNSFNTQDFISASFNSSVSYNKTFEGTPFTAGASLRINQNVNTQVTNLFPEANLAMRRIFPFKGNSTKKNPLTQLSFSYSVNARAEVTNEEDTRRYPFTSFRLLSDDITPTDVDTGTEDEDEMPDDFFGNFGTFLADAQYGAVHRIPISTNITLLKFFQLSPGFNYNEYWYPQKASYVYSEEEQGVIVNEEPGFARAFDYSGSVGMTTRLYAFYYPKIGKIEGIRHMITPSISYSYRPDFSDPRFGFFQNVQRDETGENFQKVSRFQGALYGGPSQGRSSAMSFSINNQIEAKVRGKEDSTGVAKPKKVPVLQNLSISSSYNFAADSFNLSNISMSARTQLFKNLPVVNGMSVNLNATIDPYTYELQEVTENANGTRSVTQRRTPEYAWETGNGIGQLTSAGIALSTSLSPPKEKKEKPDATEREKEQLEYIRNNPDLYIDFNVPWTLRVNYNLRYSKQGFRDASIVQTFTFSGDVKLTENWRIGFRSSYDFTQKGFGFTSLNISRDLHCWQMQMSWIPFGIRQSYNIDISVKSAILRDLKLSKRNTWFDR